MDELVGEMTGDKAELRRELRSRRSALSARERADAEVRIHEAVGSHVTKAGLGCVLMYAAVGDEVSLMNLAQGWWDGGLRLVWPRVAEDDRLTLHEAHEMSQLTPGYRGILEPSGDAPRVAWAEVELALIPGLGFDQDGGRLGQGGGHYDRLLRSLDSATKMGVAFWDQMVPRVPMEDHDVSMDIIATERGLIFCGHDS